MGRSRKFLEVQELVDSNNKSFDKWGVVSRTSKPLEDYLDADGIRAAAFFHLYGLSRDDTDYVMDTFPIVRNNDEKALGEDRTKRLILEIYDEMAESIRTGRPYVTRLDPPPADPRVAHPDTRGVRQ